MTEPSRKNAPKTRGRPFQPGNPGRPKGARNRTTVMLEDLLAGEAAALGRTAISLALAGDTTALKLCLDRLLPPVKERAARLDLPPVRTAQDALTAQSAVLMALASGELTVGEAEALLQMMTRFAETWESAELERRLEEAERQLQTCLDEGTGSSRLKGSAVQGK